MASSDFANVVGLAGVTLVVVSYFLLQIGKLRVEQLRYSLVNAIASILVLISLAAHWNLSSAIIEGFWLLISLYGCVKWLRGRRKAVSTS